LKGSLFTIDQVARDGRHPGFRNNESLQSRVAFPENLVEQPTHEVFEQNYVEPTVGFIEFV
jgi:hypothetical protein